ncbi:UDP-N-acetylmuramate dehydrogenase [Vibrio sp. SM6]|uniref:UDP-N-acetylenolpyruvoylglucosamine reductase n=1 Tax=Vibrio agarilyticus TaxID=2726741 RepID=A0A7X8TTE5_9VIBR|nr:UDP-N-acetylmuramate dehydrogenase [Vibrio agarilyticus]NLS14481.1 UDP-N-acetylmuramate dehydrogenase [Vibrio agarilyticus]
MQIRHSASLKAYHTFGIEQTCDTLVEVTSVAEIESVYRNPQWATKPKLMLGKGSNVLFTTPYQGVVILNRLLGKTVSETESEIRLHVASGEDWPELVRWCVEQGFGGLENLALIPGCAGSAPIQNIGAYGVEFKDICEYVDVLALDTFEVTRMAADECQFGYRDSIFKHQLYQRCVIVAVGLRLRKPWQAVVDYGPLQQLPPSERTPRGIYEQVCRTRMEKLPDPAVVGNAGSFFKNPIISQAQYLRLIAIAPDLVAYPSGEQYKVAAGWLIDQCGLKGLRIGGAQVNPQQALVLTNIDNSHAEDVIALATEVCQTVWQRYRIALEHEVRFIGATEETSLQQLHPELSHAMAAEQNESDNEAR